MANQDKTEKATPRRKQKAREDGDIPRSQSLTYFMNIAAGAIFILIFGQYFVQQMIQLEESLLMAISNGDKIKDFIQILAISSERVLMITVLISIILGGVNYAIQTKFYFSFKVINPKISNLNPTNYFKRLFGMESLEDMLKSLLVIVALVTNAYFTIKGSIIQIENAIMMSWISALQMFWGIFKLLFVRTLIILFIVGVMDYFFQRYNHNKKLRMTKQEVKDEMKETEGDPLMKFKQKEMMITLLKKDAISKIKETTFTVVNPTHYAVCIRYNDEIDQVPVVILKGTDYIAQFIKQLSYENRVPVVEDPPLARRLYAEVEEGWAIPPEFYKVVAKILTPIMQAK